MSSIFLAYDAELAHAERHWILSCQLLCCRVWPIAFALAALHLACIGRLLLADSMQAPFSALLDEQELDARTRVVVLMHHKRTDELNATLHGLARLQGRSLRIIVTQALQPEEAAAADDTAALLRSLGRLRLTLIHSVSTLPAPELDTSYSVNARRYGTKKNSLRNMLHGLRRAFAHDLAALARETVRFDSSGSSGEPDSLGPPEPLGAPPESVIVMEDDVALSADVLEWFDFASSLLYAARSLPPPQKPVLATSFCIMRRENADFGYGWLPSRLLFRHLEPRPEQYRWAPLADTTFKTFAWLLPREVFALLDDDFTSMLQLRGNETALHSSLHGCPYCLNFCYDHYLEWRHRRSSVICPAYPRSRQIQLGAGGGMTEKPGQHLVDKNAMERAGKLLNPHVVHAWQFVDGARFRRSVRLLDGLCAWCVPFALLWWLWWYGGGLHRRARWLAQIKGHRLTA